MLDRLTPWLRPNLWGDGFADEGWDHILQTKHWNQLNEDEYFRFYPNVGQQEIEVKATILSVVEATLAEWQDASVGRAGVRIRRREDPSFVQRACDVLVSARLQIITGTVKEVSVMAYNDFAYLTQIHPGYIWPAALISHDEAATACWLGILATGRPALLPLEVADYLADVIDQDGAVYTMRSPQMAELAHGVTSARTLLKAATARQSGGSPVVRPSRLTSLLDHLLKGRSPSFTKTLLPEAIHKESGNAHAL